MRTGFRQANNPVTGAAEGRIDAENNFVSERGGRAGHNRRGDALGHGEALLHLFKLLRSNAHGLSLPQRGEMQNIFP